MTEMQALPTAEDYRRYDRVWQRVSPLYDPYPEARREAASHPAPAAQDGEELLRVLLRRSIGDAQLYRCLCERAPGREDRRTMAALAAEEAAEARALQAAHFLLTGQTYCVTVVLPPQPRLLWRDTLRRRWQEENAESERCASAAKETDVPALCRLLRRLSESACRRAERIQCLLEKHIC